MKREYEAEKIYYDVTIDHNPEKKDLRYNFASKAETTIDLQEPLIQSPGDYNLSITKFKIDTETVPIMIPELAQPQKYSVLKGGSFETTYSVKVILKFSILNENFESVITSNVCIPFHQNQFSARVLGNLFDQTYSDTKKKNMVDAKIYVNNIDEQCFIYDYQTLLYGINEAILAALNKLKTEKVKLSSGATRTNLIKEDFDSKTAYVDIVDDKIVHYRSYKFYHFQKSTDIKLTSIALYFSSNLYKYIGNGLQTCFSSDGQWWYIPKKYYEKTLVMIETDKQTKDGVYTMKASYSTLPNWHSMKAIIIGSDNLPVVEEYLPISHENGFLTHYKKKDYTEGLNKLGIKYEYDNRDIFKKNTQRILEIYYPFTNSPGDVRSSVIFSSENPGQGQNIELMPASPIKKINIWVKWMDTYGNLYDLYLYPGCAVDIRMCFIKKTIFKKDLAEGIEALMDCFPEKKEKKPRMSNGRPDGIVIEGADQYGFVHL